MLSEPGDRKAVNRFRPDGAHPQSRHDDLWASSVHHLRSSVTYSCGAETDPVVEQAIRLLSLARGQANRLPHQQYVTVLQKSCT